MGDIDPIEPYLDIRVYLEGDASSIQGLWGTLAQEAGKHNGEAHLTPGDSPKSVRGTFTFPTRKNKNRFLGEKRDYLKSFSIGRLQTAARLFRAYDVK